MVEVPLIDLAHGARMPAIGLGLSPMDDSEAERAVTAAIGLGYRLFDTAEAYENEVGVGRGLNVGGVARDDIFITTKFQKSWHGRELVKEACERAMNRLGLDYIDLFLIHWPNPDYDHYVEAWEGMVDLLQTGHVRAIGTSNFKAKHIDRLIAEVGITPDVNQIELNPAVARPAERRFHAQQGILTEAWAPLGGRDEAGVLDEPLVQQIAAEIGRTPAQVVLRWHVELKVVPIAKTVNMDRLASNIDIFDFELSESQMDALATIDQCRVIPFDSDTFGH